VTSVAVDKRTEISPTIQPETNIVIPATIGKRVVTGGQGFNRSITPVNRYLTISGEVRKTKAIAKDPPPPELIGLADTGVDLRLSQVLAVDSSAFNRRFTGANQRQRGRTSR